MKIVKRSVGDCLEAFPAVLGLLSASVRNWFESVPTGNPPSLKFDDKTYS